MFLVHYPIVLWLQYWCSISIARVVKALVAFVDGRLSWAATAALRKIRARRVL